MAVINSTPLRFFTYLFSSFKSIPSIALLAFNLYVIFQVAISQISLQEAIIVFVVQLILTLLTFCSHIMTLRRFTDGKTVIEKGKGFLTGLIIWVFFILLINGLLIGAMSYYWFANFNESGISVILATGFIVGVIIILIQSILSFIFNFKVERERLEKAPIIYTFFESFGYVFPLYVILLFMMALEPLWIAFLILKTIVDLVIYSPKNFERPFFFPKDYDKYYLK